MQAGDLESCVKLAVEGKPILLQHKDVIGIAKIQQDSDLIIKEVKNSLQKRLESCVEVEDICDCVGLLSGLESNNQELWKDFIFKYEFYTDAFYSIETKLQHTYSRYNGMSEYEIDFLENLNQSFLYSTVIFSVCFNHCFIKKYEPPTRKLWLHCELSETVILTVALIFRQKQTRKNL